jgi:hypothetical protein
MVPVERHKWNMKELHSASALVNAAGTVGDAMRAITPAGNPMHDPTATGDPLPA